MTNLLLSQKRTVYNKIRNKTQKYQRPHSNYIKAKINNTEIWI